MLRPFLQILLGPGRRLRRDNGRAKLCPFVLREGQRAVVQVRVADGTYLCVSSGGDSTLTLTTTFSGCFVSML